MAEHVIFTPLEINGLIVKWYYAAFALPRPGFDSRWVQPVVKKILV